MIVVDCNLIAYLLIQGGFTREAEAVFRIDPEWVAPHLWRSELRNVLVNHVRHRSMPLDQAVLKMSEAEAIMRGTGLAVGSDAVLTEAADAGVSAYDAEYLAAARQLRLPLVTCDTKLQQAKPDVALSPRKFLRL